MRERGDLKRGPWNFSGSLDRAVRYPMKLIIKIKQRARTQKLLAFCLVLEYITIRRTNLQKTTIAIPIPESSKFLRRQWLKEVNATDALGPEKGRLQKGGVGRTIAVGGSGIGEIEKREIGRWTARNEAVSVGRGGWGAAVDGADDELPRRSSGVGGGSARAGALHFSSFLDLWDRAVLHVVLGGGVVVGGGVTAAVGGGGLNWFNYDSREI